MGILDNIIMPGALGTLRQYQMRGAGQGVLESLGPQQLRGVAGQTETANKKLEAAKKYLKNRC